MDDKKSFLYVCTTKDEYELPIAVADTIDKLAEMVGVSRRTVIRGLNKTKNGGSSIYRRVIL